MNRKEYYKLWYAKNISKRKEYNKKYRKKHKDRYKEYRIKNKDRIKEYQIQRRIKLGWKPKTDFLYTKDLCHKCKRDDVPLMKGTKTTRGQYHICRACNLLHSKNYRKTKNGRKRVNEAVYRSMKKHQKRQNARANLNYHVRSGHIVRPDKCSVCLKKTKVEGHHKDYSKPLEVTWACRQCHADLHKLCE